jgi:hypothetical protein
VGIAVAILAAHAFRELPWNQLSALVLTALALCAVALLAAYWTIVAALWFGTTQRNDHLPRHVTCGDTPIASYCGICGQR